jgi:hypothetical protein
MQTRGQCLPIALHDEDMSEPGTPDADSSVTGVHVVSGDGVSMTLFPVVHCCCRVRGLESFTMQISWQVFADCLA